MEISKSFSIILLLLIVTLIQFNDCYNQRFPSNFDQFPTAHGTRFNFTGSKKYAKLFCIEEMFLKLKQIYNPLNPQKNLVRIAQEFRSLNDKIEEYYTNSARNPRSFSNLKDMIKIMCTRTIDLPTMDDLDSFMAEAYDGMIDEIILYDNMASEAISDAISDTFRSFPSEDRSIVPGYYKEKQIFFIILFNTQ